MAIWFPPQRRFQQLSYWQRVRKTNEWLLSVNPFYAYLWIKKIEGIACTCIKDTTEQSDKKCTICYGTKLVGGYDKWGFVSTNIDSQYEGLEIDNHIKVWTELRPHRMVLDRGWERGEIITPFVSQTNSLGWDGYSVDDYVYDEEHSGIDYYYQARGSDEWKPLSHINFPALTETDNFYRFKIVLWRDNQTYKSPVFGMIQVRYQVKEIPRMRMSRKSMGNRQNIREEYGNIEGEGGLQYWTLDAPTIVTTEWVRAGYNPISSVTPFTKREREIPIIHTESFLELHTGQQEDKRYSVVAFQQSEPGGVLLSQHFSLRILQPHEIYYKVF